MSKNQEPVTPSPAYRHTPPSSGSSNSGIVERLDSPVSLLNASLNKNDNLRGYDALARRISALQKIHSDYRRREQHIPVGLFPAIVVCGDQSAGKSSLLAAITGIPFDTGSGLKTRGATIVYGKHTTSAPFSAKIRTYINGVTEQTIGKPNETFIMNNPEHMLKHVQTCAEYLSKYDEKNSAEPSTFNNHVVVIEARGPQVQSSIVVDLPGLITEDASKDKSSGLKDGDHKRVRDLLARWISRSDTSILVCTNAINELNSVQTLSFAKTFDPTGDRTFAAFTHVDMIKSVTQCSWLPFWKGATNSSRHGSFLVHLMDPEDEDEGEAFSVEYIRTREAEEFAAKKWAKVKDVLSKCKLGSKYLGLAMTKAQSTNVVFALKEASSIDRVKLQTLDLEIAGLARTPEEPVVNVQRSAIQIGHSLRSKLDPVDGYVELFEARHSLCARLQAVQQTVEVFDTPPPGSGCRPVDGEQPAAWQECSLFMKEGEFGDIEVNRGRAWTQTELLSFLEKQPQFRFGQAWTDKVGQDLRNLSKDNITWASQLFLQDICEAVRKAVADSVQDALGGQELVSDVKDALTTQVADMQSKLATEIQALLNNEFNQAKTFADMLDHHNLHRSAMKHISNCSAPHPHVCRFDGSTKAINARHQTLATGAHLMADQVRIFKHYARCVLQVVQTRLEEFAQESEVFIFRALKLHNIAAVADARVVKRLGDRQVNGDESRKRVKLAEETEEVKNRISTLASAIDVDAEAVV